MKRGFQIKKIAARKKADPQAVQRGRLFRAALFARFSFGCVFRRALVRRAKRADSYNTSTRRSAILRKILFFLYVRMIELFSKVWYNNPTDK